MIELIRKIPENYLIPDEWPVMVFFGALALVLLIGAGAMASQRYPLYQDGVPAQGSVVETERQQSRSKNKEGRWETRASDHPVIEFTAAGGAKHRFTGDIPRGLFKYGAIGSTVNVLYDPKDPSTARIAHFAEFWLEPLYYGVPGFLMLTFCIGLFFFYQHRLVKEHASYAEAARESERANRLHRDKQIGRLMAAGTVHLLNGVVESVSRRPGAVGEEYVVVCRATPPDGVLQERFEAVPISYHPGPALIGKSVEIYVHREDKTRYQVNLDPVLEELRSAER